MSVSKIVADWPTRRQEAGAAMITSLILLLVMTMLAVTTMRNATLEERMATNAALKYRTFQAAESAVAEALDATEDYEAKEENTTPTPITVSSPEEAIETEASIRALGSPGDPTCRPALGRSMDGDDECGPNDAHLAEITVGAELISDNKPVADSEIVVGVAYKN
ncbi:MAG: PilX N-terminal domain-containing pilus assembly protein [Halofilum sp. (in: g-proteobacteria)]